MLVVVLVVMVVVVEMVGGGNTNQVRCLVTCDRSDDDKLNLINIKRSIS